MLDSSALICYESCGLFWMQFHKMTFSIQSDLFHSIELRFIHIEMNATNIYHSVEEIKKKTFLIKWFKKKKKQYPMET